MDKYRLKYLRSKIIDIHSIFIFVFIPFFIYSIASTFIKYYQVKMADKPFYDFADSCDLISPVFIPVHIVLAFISAVIIMRLISKRAKEKNPNYNKKWMFLNTFCFFYIVIKLIALYYLKFDYYVSLLM